MIGTFDGVVVGGGSAGIVVAGRLADDPGNRFLVFEAGSCASEHPETLRADGHTKAFAADDATRDRFSTPAAKKRVTSG